ncbi:MAG: hypothetical protein V1871_05825 [Planctomycetota bacterium]
MPENIRLYFIIGLTATILIIGVIVVVQLIKEEVSRDDKLR